MFTILALFILYLSYCSCAVPFDNRQSSSWDNQCPTRCTCELEKNYMKVWCRKLGLTTIPTNLSSEIKHFNLNYNNISILPNDIFRKSGLLKVKNLYFIDCQIQVVQKFAFRDLEDLEYVDLSNNTILKLEIGGFETNILLKILRLNYNPLSRIDGVFPQLINLNNLDLKNCQLSGFENHALDNLSDLTYLDLSGNLFETIPVALLQPLTKLKQLRLQLNHWRCDCELKDFWEWTIQSTDLELHNDTMCSEPYDMTKRRWKDLTWEIDCALENSSSPAIQQTIMPARVVENKIATLPGLPVNFSCETNGIPIRSCLWVRHGLDVKFFVNYTVEKRIPEGYQYTGLGLHNGYCGMHINSTSRADSATWSCTLATTNAPTYVGQVQLNVLNCEGILTSECLNSTEAMVLSSKYQPKIIGGKLESTFNEHSNDRLTCQTVKLPEILKTSIEWWRNDQRITSDDRLSEDNRRNRLILEFNDVGDSDAGKYDCFAENKFNRTQQTFIVRVKKGQETGPLEPVMKTNGWIVGLSIAVSLIVCFSMLAAVIFYKNRLNEMYELTEEEIQRFLNGNPELDNVENISEDHIDYIPYDKSFEIPSSQFHLETDSESTLGKGAFGTVYKGTCLNQTVAIKTVSPKSQMTNMDYNSNLCIRSLFSEIKLMIYLAVNKNNSHTTGRMNIVALIGANTENIRKGVYLLVEYCELGSLEQYLRNNRHIFVDESSNYENCFGEALNPTRSSAELRLCTTHLMKWAYEVSNGMEYISSRKIIHRDLATRNVLLTSSKVAKITDFGLSRRLYQYSVYNTHYNQEPLPWRWMAIESLKDLAFSTHSDAWSFGITLWEIFSLAEVPYPGLAWTIDFVAKLENGIRPIQPKYAHLDVFRLMEQTWHEIPEKRLNFTEIRLQLRSILEGHTNQNYVSIGSVNPTHAEHRDSEKVQSLTQTVSI